MKISNLWIEAAHEIWPVPVGEEAGVIVRFSSLEDRFSALMAHGEGWAALPARVALLAAWDALSSGAELAPTIERLLATLPVGVHLPWSILHAGPTSGINRRPMQLLECDAPPMFYARSGEVMLLPVIEEEACGRLLRRCDFDVEAGDHLALASRSYIRAHGGAKPWNWRNIALSVRRLTATGSSAEELAGALARITNQRINASASQLGGSGGTIDYPSFAILAMRVRPMRSATVWSGPPSQRTLEPVMLSQFMAEEDIRVICGDTTAEVAARLLDARIEMERQPSNGWREVPPVSQMVVPDGCRPVTLVTEGVITLRAAAERVASSSRPRDLLGREDGASRLAKLLLEADKITFLVGLAVNPAQTERDGTPLRKAALDRLADRLQAKGKVVTLVYS